MKMHVEVVCNECKTANVLEVDLNFDNFLIGMRDICRECGLDIDFDVEFQPVVTVY